MEVAEVQATGIEQKQNCAVNSQDVMAVSSTSNIVKETFFNSAGTFPHFQGRSCLAKGKIWHACGKQGHFGRCCHSKPQGGSKSKRQLHLIQAEPRYLATILLLS